MKPIKRVVVIGVGGIGCMLLQPLAMYLAYTAKEDNLRFVLIDGDTFEPKNKERQIFKDYGNKADIKADEIAQQFEELSVRSVGEYVTPQNIAELILDGDVVFTGVDNHKARKWISDHCGTLPNIVLISGGNDYIDGNVYTYIRESGVDLVPPITETHQEIADPRDKSPSEMSCEELAALNVPQLLFTNLNAATAMLNAFYRWHSESGKTGEVYFDIVEGMHNLVER